MSEDRSIYLDYNATAPLAAEAAEAMSAWLQEYAANPSSLHVHGQRARAAVEGARAAIACFLGGEPNGVVFTSGGTEADNLALWGATGYPPQAHVVVSAIEHPAILEPAAALEKLGVSVTRVGVDRDGVVDPDVVGRALRPETRLVSIMAANNEVGALQPVAEIAALARANGTLIHCDAVQAAPWMPLAPLTAAVDLLTISSHKLAGPAGAGALYVRPGVSLEPFVRGGSQQFGRRGGTEPTALIVGFAAACERATALQSDAARRIAGLRDRLERRLLDEIQEIQRSGPSHGRLPNTSHLCFAGCDGNALVARLDLDGVAAAAGAACSTGVPGASHVLEAMGVEDEYAGGSLRLSLGHETSEADVDGAARIIPRAVAALRGARVEALS